MFGKPQWFRPKTIGWGLVPISWQGWAYTGGWAAAIAGPFALLLTRQQPLEALTWMGLGIGALAYDVRQILRAKRSSSRPAAQATGKQDDNVLYILDNGAPAPVATRNFNLQMRRQA